MELYLPNIILNTSLIVLIHYIYKLNYNIVKLRNDLINLKIINNNRYEVIMEIINNINDNNIDSLNKINNTIIDIEYIKLNKNLQEEFITKLQYDRDMLNINDKFYILNNDYINT